MLTSATTAMGLLDLPDDVLKIALSRRYLSPTALVECACVSKAAAAVALPELYRDLPVPAIAALPLIYSTLQARPKLAQHVRSITASRYFALSYDLQDEAAVQECRVLPGSPIVSVSKVTRRLGLAKLNSKLPMPWLVRIAKICPNLTAVDLSPTKGIGINAPGLFLGLNDLANILRARRGRFVCRAWPFSSVLVKDRVISVHVHSQGGVVFTRNVYHVDSVDWGRKQIAVTDFLCAVNGFTTDFAFVPFRDLVPLDDQANWAIGEATLRNHATKHDIMSVGMWTVSGWLKSKNDMWLKGGLVEGQDRLFDFESRPPGVIKGKVALGLPIFDVFKDVAESIGLDPDRQCPELIMDGPSPGDMVNFPPAQLRTFVTMSIRVYSTMAAEPMQFLSCLQFTSAFFLDKPTVAKFMVFLAHGAPNLARLALLNAACPVDIIVHHADSLIRRSRCEGKLLQDLTVSSFAPHPQFTPNDWPFMEKSSPKSWPLAEVRRPRSLLGNGNAGTQLASLTLEVEGTGVHFLNSNNAATVAIHPDILRNLRSLRLESVQLYLPPPHLAQPDSPSFLPLAHIPPSAQKLCPVNHMLTLPNLERLCVTSNALNFPNHCVPANSPSPVLHALPQLPALRHLTIFLDHVHEQSKLFTTAIVAPVLRRFPSLEFAAFAHLVAKGSREQRERALVDEFFKPYPRELGPCPKLRCLKVNVECIDYYQWLVSRGREVSGPMIKLSQLAVEC